MEFTRADTLYPGAAPKYQIAICYDKLGKTQDAIAAYRRFIDSGPSAKYAGQVQEAQKRIAELEKSGEGTVTLAITPPNIAGLAIKVDGNPAQGLDLKLPAGTHNIEITAPGYLPLTQTVEVQAGAAQSLTLTLTPAAGQPPQPPTPPAPDDDGDDGEALRIAGLVTLGVGVIAGVVTTVFGVQALGSASDFDATPTEELADDTETKALLADVFLGVTGALAITGVILIAVGYAKKGDSESGAVPHVTPYAGRGGGGAVAEWRF
jgi:hypothetical protein